MPGSFERGGSGVRLRRICVTDGNPGLPLDPSRSPRRPTGRPAHASMAAPPSRTRQPVAIFSRPHWNIRPGHLDFFFFFFFAHHLGREPRKRGAAAVGTIGKLWTPDGAADGLGGRRIRPRSRPVGRRTRPRPRSSAVELSGAGWVTRAIDGDIRWALSTQSPPVTGTTVVAEDRKNRLSARTPGGCTQTAQGRPGLSRGIIRGLVLPRY